MSPDVLLSGAARLLAKLWKAMRLPSLLIDGSSERLLLATPALLTLTSTVVPATTSRRNTSRAPLVSSVVRLMAALLKATNWPLKLTDGWSAPPLGVNRPAALTLTASVVLAAWPL